jgi:TatD DNase family protein
LGVVHCFSGDEDLAWKYFNLGLFISFTGLITFSKQWDELIRKMPLDKIMIETDTPYMTPEPHRGQRNEPVLVQYVAKRIAEIKNLKIEKVAEVTFENAKNLFRI